MDFQKLMRDIGVITGAITSLVIAWYIILFLFPIVIVALVIAIVLALGYRAVLWIYSKIKGKKPTHY